MVRSPWRWRSPRPRSLHRACQAAPKAAAASEGIEGRSTVGPSGGKAIPFDNIAVCAP
jgi:hypothetical protein